MVTMVTPGFLVLSIRLLGIVITCLNEFSPLLGLFPVVQVGQSRKHRWTINLYRVARDKGIQDAGKMTHENEDVCFGLPAALFQKCDGRFEVFRVSHAKRRAATAVQAMTLVSWTQARITSVKQATKMT